LARGIPLLGANYTTLRCPPLCRFKSELDALRGEFEAYKTAAEVRAGQMAHEAKELQAQAAKQQGEMKALHAENHALLQRKVCVCPRDASTLHYRG
jgi:hypothetical protein